jgi:PAS domain S-box-containing protein
MSLHDSHRLQERLASVADPVGFLVNLFTHAPVGFAVWDVEGTPLLTNRAFVELFGSEPPPGYNVLRDDLVAESGMLTLFQRAFAGETVHVPTFWYDPRDLKTVEVREGRRVAVSMTIFPLFRASGELEYVAATYKDDTEIMRAQERLERSEEQHRLAHQAAQVGTFEWNIQTGVNRWSPELEAMYGLRPGDFGKTQPSWEQLLHPDDRAVAVDKVNEAFESPHPVEAEWRVVRPDGSVRWLFGRFQVFRDGAGVPHRLIGANVDITGRKQAEEKIRTLNEDLERLVQERTAQLTASNRELEAFSYSVAHDLRAPLRSINGFAKILQLDHADKLDADGADCLQRIHRNTLLMEQLIDALLSLARVTRSAFEPMRTDLSELARSIVGQLAASEPSHPVDVTVQEGMRAQIHPTLARTLVENLIGNAWKFTRHSVAPRVEVGVTEVEGGRAFFVRDNGAGFNMAHAGKLFVPFQRLHSAGEYPGTGIGLATAHRIVGRHGGRIWGEGQVGAGATFFFTLPPPEPEG